jgi:hypothetical protein
MPIPINRNPDNSYGLLGAIRDFISPPGYAARGPLGSVPAGASPSGRPPMPGLPKNYKQTELAAGAAAEAFRPGAGFPGQQVASNPGERAYQEEVSRVAQLAAQNPELQRYEKARAVAKSQEEMNAVRDEGMRIWAAKNPGLAAKVKPGSTGYEAIQGVVGASAPSALSNEQVLGVMSFDPNTVLSTTQNIQGQYRPNQALTDQEILAAMSFDPNVAMRSAANIGFAPMPPVEAAMLKDVGGAQGEYITPMNAVGSPDQVGLSFVTPAEQRRQQSTALFQELLNRANAKTK